MRCCRTLRSGQRYDELGANWQAGGDFTPPPAGEGADGVWRFRRPLRSGRTGEFSDFFETLFGGFRGARAGPGFAMRGADVEADLSLALEDIQHGATRTLTLQAAERCPSCGGYWYPE